MELFGFETIIFGVDKELSFLGFNTQGTTTTQGTQQTSKANTTQQNAATTGVKGPGFNANKKSTMSVEDKEGDKKFEELPRPPKPLSLPEARKELLQTRKALIKQFRGHDSKLDAKADEQITQKTKALLKNLEKSLDQAKSQLKTLKPDSSQHKATAKNFEILTKQEQALKAADVKFAMAQKNVEKAELAHQAKVLAEGQPNSKTSYGSVSKVLYQKVADGLGLGKEGLKNIKTADALKKHVDQQIVKVLDSKKKELGQLKDQLKTATPENKALLKKKLEQAKIDLQKMEAGKSKLTNQLKLLMKFEKMQADPTQAPLLTAAVLKGKSLTDLMLEGKVESVLAFMKAANQANLKENGPGAPAPFPEIVEDDVEVTSSQQALTSSESESSGSVGGFGAQSAGSSSGTSSAEGDYMLTEVEEATVAGEEYGTLMSGDGVSGGFGAASATGSSDFSAASASDLNMFVAASAVNFSAASAASTAKQKMYQTDKQIKKLILAVQSGNADLLTFALMMMEQRDRLVYTKIGAMGVSMMAKTAQMKEGVMSQIQGMDANDPKYAANLQGSTFKMQKYMGSDQSVMDLIRIARTAMDERKNNIHSMIGRESQIALQLSSWR